MTEESIDPRRTLPRALVLGAIALTVTYLLVNAGYLHVLGRDGLAASTLPGADLIARIFHGAGAKVFLVLAILAALGSLNGAALSAPRVAYALGRSGLGPEPLTRVTRLGTPDLATLWFAVAWGLYAWFGSFEGLVSVSIFIGALCNVAVTATIFIHRRRAGGAEGCRAVGRRAAPSPARPERRGALFRGRPRLRLPLPPVPVAPAGDAGSLGRLRGGRPAQPGVEGRLRPRGDGDRGRRLPGPRAPPHAGAAS